MLFMLLAASLAHAKSPQQQMFPNADSCYARTYSKDHLARHPQQRVTQIVVSPDFAAPDPTFAVHLQLTLRGTGGGAAETTGYCKNTGAKTISCGMEGDACGFQITPAKSGGVLITVSSRGMCFETDTDFVVLEPKTGDDRSFLLQPVACR